jgi:hypothetical protein
MAGSPPEHHMVWMGYCLDDCSGADVFAFERLKIVGHRGRSDRAHGHRERKSPYLGHTGVSHRSRRRFARIICCAQPASLAAGLGRRLVFDLSQPRVCAPGVRPSVCQVVSPDVSTEGLTIILCLSASSIVGSVVFVLIESPMMRALRRR